MVMGKEGTGEIGRTVAQSSGPAGIFWKRHSLLGKSEHSLRQVTEGISFPKPAG